MQPLQIFIRHRETKNFYKNARSWTDDIRKARSFPTALAAFFYAAEEELRDVEVVWLRGHDSQLEKVGEQRVNPSPMLQLTARRQSRRMAVAA